MSSALALFYLFFMAVAAQLIQPGIPVGQVVKATVSQGRLSNEVKFENGGEIGNGRSVEHMHIAQAESQVALKAAPRSPADQDSQPDPAPFQRPLMVPSMTEFLSVTRTTTATKNHGEAMATLARRLPPPSGVKTVAEPAMMTSDNSPAQSSAVQSSISSISSEIASKSAIASEISSELNHENVGSVSKLMNSDQLFSICSLFVALVSLSIAACL